MKIYLKQLNKINEVKPISLIGLIKGGSGWT